MSEVVVERVPWHASFARCAKPYRPGLVAPCTRCGCECGGYLRDGDRSLCWKCYAAVERPAQLGFGL